MNWLPLKAFPAFYPYLLPWFPPIWRKTAAALQQQTQDALCIYFGERALGKGMNHNDGIK